MALEFSKLEEKVLQQWRDKKIFEKSLKLRAKGPKFVFFEGPPTANGKPGIHHVLARAFKDLIPRYKTMRGYFVDRKAGWDTHGLPVELQVEKALGISGKPQIENIVPGDKFESIKQFNAKCKESVFAYKQDWEKLTERIAYWVDLSNPYITYDNAYIESLWSVLRKFWDDKLLYQDYKVVPYCSRCGTALSSHEVAQGYKDIKETSVYVKFLIPGTNSYFLAWTTTPWTLPGNVALAIGPDIIYVNVKHKGENLILAKDRLSVLEGEYEISGPEMNGKKLAELGLSYIPLFDVIPNVPGTPSVFPVVLADFVTTTDGTGVVHTAVMYGEDDFSLGQKIGLPKFHTVDEQGKFVAEVAKFAGRKVKEVEPEIIEDLSARGLVYKTEKILHSYPFCWRCDTQLLYYAKVSWFIRVTEFKKKLLANNEKINWVPETIKHGRFGDWLENVKDWAISRERYWGTPLPIWVCSADADHKVCVGSVDELNKLAGSKVAEDLHRPFIDEVQFKCSAKKCTGEMTRIKDVADVWFDSGAMPFAQWHYPFENVAKIDKSEAFPADYIAEAIDQTRGWFYTLLAVSTLLNKGTPYKNVVCLGHILDTKGQKMSKSKGNIVEPWSVIDKYGSDALRWHLFTVNPPGEPKRFDVKNVEDVVKKIFLILWNVYTFYSNYAGTEKIAPKFGTHNVLDLWVSSRTEDLRAKVTEHLDKYEILEAGRLIADYIDELSTWYLRRSRDRFKSDDKKDAAEALSTLGACLNVLIKLMAPFTPFLADELYQRLGGDKESVHLTDWPEAETKIKVAALEDMKTVRRVCEAAHALRSQAGLKVRQVLSEVVVNQDLSTALLDLIKDELNVKAATFKKDFKPSDKLIVSENGGLKVGLNIELTDALKEEGLVREIVRGINGLRKAQKLTIHDRVTIKCSSDEKSLEAIITKYNEEIKSSVLADKIDVVAGTTGEKIEINEFVLNCEIAK